MENRNEQLTNELQSEAQRRQTLELQLADRQQKVELFQVDPNCIQGELARTAEQVSILQAEREQLNQHIATLGEGCAAADEQASFEPVEVPAEPNVEPSEFAAESTFYSEPSQETSEFQDANATEESCETEDAYNSEAEQSETVEPHQFDETTPVSWNLPDDTARVPSEPAELDLSVKDTTLTDQALENSEDVEEITEKAPVGSDSIAGENQGSEAEQPAEEFKSTSFIEQYQHLLEDEEELEIQPVQRDLEPAQLVNKLGAEIDAIESGHEEDSDDVALEAYMSNMMRRVRGDDDSQAPQSSSTTELNRHPNPVSAFDNVSNKTATAVAVPEQSEDLEPIDMESLKRSSLKPALPADLTAMRELANNSARSAISKHHKRLHLEKALGLFFVCLVFICVGGYMLWTAAAAQEFKIREKSVEEVSLAIGGTPEAAAGGN